MIPKALGRSDCDGLVLRVRGWFTWSTWLEGASCRLVGFQAECGWNVIVYGLGNGLD